MEVYLVLGTFLISDKLIIVDLGKKSKMIKWNKKRVIKFIEIHK